MLEFLQNNWKLAFFGIALGIVCIIIGSYRYRLSSCQAEVTAAKVEYQVIESTTAFAKTTNKAIEKKTIHTIDNIKATKLSNDPTQLIDFAFAQMQAASYQAA